jgi:hypothetical protein
MKRRLVTALSLAGLLAGVSALRAASPSSGTLAAGATAQWNGTAGVSTAPAEGELTCVDGTNCDVYTLKIVPGNYLGKRVRFKVTWGSPTNDFDVYVHRQTLTGPEAQRAATGDPAEENSFDLDGVVVAGVNDTFVFHIVYFAIVSPDVYQGSAVLEDIPPIAPGDYRVASFVKGDKTGIRFSRSRSVYAAGAAKDVEPSARVDFLGNAYAGGIRGLTGGNDVWRFDLNPSSPTYDPFLKAATPVWDLAGNAANPAYTGQPDSTVPDKEGDLGGDGGGDLDLAVAFKAAPGTAPTLAAASLLAANVSTQRSVDRGDSYTNNPAGNTTVPVDDRQWLEFLGDRTVYLAYRDFTGLQATSKYYVNRSDDGGLTYGPAVVAAVGGNTTGNIDVDQKDGTVYFCHQGPSPNDNQVRVAIGQPVSLSVQPLAYTVSVAATGRKPIAALFPVCKVAADGTVYVAYSDGGDGIFINHSRDHGKTWAVPVQVSDLGHGSVALMPWIETGDAPGSLAVVWYGTSPADNEVGLSGNNDYSNWRVYYAQVLNATASRPTVLQTWAGDHYNHGSNISLAGFTTGSSPNRNLADFFQVAVDPLGMAFVAFADDSKDFSGHTYVTHQIAGPSLHTGKPVRIKGSDTDAAIDPSRPQVMDFAHDAVAFQPPPVRVDADTPNDIISIAYSCERQTGRTLVAATLKASGLDVVPPNGVWRMNFSTNPTQTGLVDRADQWFVQAETDDTGARSFSFGTAVRNGDGSITYTTRGAADAGWFDPGDRSVTVKADLAKLNALASRGPIGAGTTLLGLRGSASIERYTVAGLVGVGLADSTRAGVPFTLPKGCF